MGDDEPWEREIATDRTVRVDDNEQVYWIRLCWTLPYHPTRNHCLQLPEENVDVVFERRLVYISTCILPDPLLLTTSIQLASLHGRNVTTRNGYRILPLYFSEACPRNVFPACHRHQRLLKVHIPVVVSYASGEEKVQMRAAVQDLHLSYEWRTGFSAAPTTSISVFDPYGPHLCDQWRAIFTCAFTGIVKAVVFWFRHPLHLSTNDLYENIHFVPPRIIAVEIDVPGRNSQIFPSCDFIHHKVKGRTVCWLVPLASEFTSLSSLKRWRDQEAPLETNAITINAFTQTVKIRFVSDPTVESLYASSGMPNFLPIHLAFLCRSEWQFF